MNTNINPKSLELIADLSNAFGPSGFEDAVFDVAKKHCGDMAQVTDDCLRNIYIRPNKPAKGLPVFMLDAHCDEVGFMVHSIRPNAKFCTPACRQRFYRQQKRELPPPDAVSEPEPVETNKTA